MTGSSEASGATGREGALEEDALEQVLRERGDSFSEVGIIAEVAPETLRRIHRCAGYVHGYAGQTTHDQVLSEQMRELIALTHLCAMRDDRFAPNHVRRLYRLGVADEVIIEAAEAIAPAVGHSTVLGVAHAIEQANSDSYPFGAMPEGGRPKRSTPFPEMNRWPVPAPASPQATLWPRLAGIDPELVLRYREFLDHCLGSPEWREPVLGPVPRGLILVPALAARGSRTLVAVQVERLIGYGVGTRELVEAVACALPMTGAATMDEFLEAIEHVDLGGEG
ncbi:MULTISPECIES: carboxymuconolactone decarboxylase family protein [Actinomadura]|uniref:Uncharacterized conserved protein YurZ, alkylhydroperoxidase/carboxymuconolactone decarboxylase family n=1 Tax=Actinomadura madurae TaxID=1993 RepID=A0A1I5NGD4_9ACTN|nr:carboxymuconolactone decarboxylase family protein [Actinomadura madurae]SFP20271.1 Uncharacterized conserved protein YurZ, alkylhydroperoxidase/carboxymuconolactone decarboxylase family [Actinomadura madurae]